MIESNYICHYGVKNQRWGDRKYQYRDGSLTPEGRKHYGVGEPREGNSESTSSNATTKKKLTDEERTQLARTKSARYQAQAEEMNAKTRYLQSKKDYAKASEKPAEPKKDEVQDEINELRRQKELIQARTDFINAQKAYKAATFTPKEESWGKELLKKTMKDIAEKSITQFEDYAFDQLRKALYPTTPPKKSEKQKIDEQKELIKSKNALKEEETRHDQYNHMSSDEIWKLMEKRKNK